MSKSYKANDLRDIFPEAYGRRRNHLEQIEDYGSELKVFTRLAKRAAVQHTDARQMVRARKDGAV